MPAAQSADKSHRRSGDAAMPSLLKSTVLGLGLLAGRGRRARNRFVAAAESVPRQLPPRPHAPRTKVLPNPAATGSGKKSIIGPSRVSGRQVAASLFDFDRSAAGIALLGPGRALSGYRCRTRNRAAIHTPPMVGPGRTNDHSARRTSISSIRDPPAYRRVSCLRGARHRQTGIVRQPRKIPLRRCTRIQRAAWAASSSCQIR